MRTGNHKELIALKGSYYHLVKNQLDLRKINMPQNSQDIEIRSEEVQEILTQADPNLDDTLGKHVTAIC